MKHLNDVIISPVISEKSMAEVAKGRFTFVVANDANKKNVKRAVEERFKVSVVGVSTNITKGKTTRAGARRTEIVKPAYKKAIVQLKEGQKIDMFDVD